ncbi:Piso0_005733 [Millerozyma farinosa CBS 7064]|uniref:Piso0_005733 protein n=1 Tax=Pichia sorbitophila (strain ATCC MYA-4447 / BCRC 22081 / CBS 7064 / NBRC 10061 / NRRL Y-12695) TaxID=559304 RepID=G8XZT1_PICSO|nr:Piso0_005733 [Millerozyma farinosa CBS 7064]
MFKRSFQDSKSIFACLCRSQPRAYSTMNGAQGRHQATFKNLLKAPAVKSLMLTLVFGTSVVEFMKKKRDLEALDHIYNAKINILEDIISRLVKNEKVDIQKELRIINSMTKYKYNTSTDIDIDEGLEKWLQQEDKTTLKEAEEKPAKQVDSKSDKQAVTSKDFL